jgi:hypothetical protein
MRMGQFTGPTGGEYGAMSDYVLPIDMFYPSKSTPSNEYDWTLEGGLKQRPGQLSPTPYNPYDALTGYPKVPGSPPASKGHY